MLCKSGLRKNGFLHGRSGRVALPRVKVVLLGLAWFGREERIRRAERAEDGRRSVLDMLRQAVSCFEISNAVFI